MLLTHRAQACLCSCTGGLKRLRSVPSFTGGGISLRTCFSYQLCGKSRFYARNFSNSRLVFSGIEQRARLYEKGRAVNSSESQCFSETRPGMAGENAEGEGDRRGRVIVIAGPTGVGKTRLALALAKRLGGEIISADSVQVYRNLDVGSAKTPMHEREGIPHHLIDIVNPSQDYTAGYFYDDARAATELVLSKGSVPIVVGGTGMYLRWYMNGKVGAPKATKEVFAAVEEEVDRLISEGGGWDAGLRMLADAGDLTTGPSLARNDWYRLRRALEIIKTSGQPKSAFSKLMNGDEYSAIEGANWDYKFQCYFLYQPRPDLYRKVDQRCEQMVQEGLLEEASSLLNSGLQPSSNSATRSIGYQLAMGFLMECRELGGVTTKERFLIFLEEFQRASRNYVKRQITWFRNKGQSEQLFNWTDANQALEEMVDALAEEYDRPNEEVSIGLKEASAAVKESSYTEEKLLKVYRTQNRIFSADSEAIKQVLDWIRRTQCQHQSGCRGDDIEKISDSTLTSIL